MESVSTKGTNETAPEVQADLTKLPKTEFEAKFGSYLPNIGSIGENFYDACNYYCNPLMKTYKTTDTNG